LNIREVRVLAALSKGPMTLHEVSHGLGIPKASAHRILLKFVADGLAVRDEAKRYAITEKGRRVLEEVSKMLG